VELEADADVDEVAAVVAVLAVLVVWNIDWKLVIATMAGTPFWSEVPHRHANQPNGGYLLRKIITVRRLRTTGH
jgi:hypothetical protein